MLTRATDIFIEELIDATYPNWQDERSRHVLAQALHGLVRQARSEQLLEIRRDAERAAGNLVTYSARRQAKALLRRIESGSGISQQQERRPDVGDGTDGNRAGDAPGRGMATRLPRN